MDNEKLQEILEIVREIDICLNGKKNDFNDSGLIGQVAKNTTNIKWLHWLYAVTIFGIIGIIVENILW